VEVCRTPGCAETPGDHELGYCSSCHEDYERRRGVARLLGEHARCAHWQLFAALTDEQALALAEHAAGNAQIGRHAIGWAINELLAEAHETGLQALAAGSRTPLPPSARPPLRVIAGGRR
jgi:hypothetical protein